MESKGKEQSSASSSASRTSTRKVGIVYDERMCQHANPKDTNHVENPDRIKVVWEKLNSDGLAQRCVRVNSREASDDELGGVHTKKHIKIMKSISSAKYDTKRDKVAKSYNSIYFNSGSSESAVLSAGCVIEMSEKVASGELNAGVAIVRPPGHHAEADEAMGFCLFNNIAVAAKHLVYARPELGIGKVLIVDWDVHHGNGTQRMFWTDPHVLYFSVHRFDAGSFYPGGREGSHEKIGEGAGAGYNINVPWEHKECGDADYLAVWDHILVPVARNYNPDLILISGGFDAAIHDPLGECQLTPNGYLLMTQKLMEFAGGKIVLALEGGYNLESLANSFAACVNALLTDKPGQRSPDLFPFESTWGVIKKVRQELSSFWPVLSEDLPTPKLIKFLALSTCDKQSSGSSDEISESGGEESEDAGNVTASSTVLASPVEITRNIIQSMKELRVDEDRYYNETPFPLMSTSKDCNQSTTVSIGNNIAACSWRLLLRKTYVWYACYGSNMWNRRFLCYIEGGQVEGMGNPCCGSQDKTPPQATKWKEVPHRIFFGRSYSKTWGPGGVAFLHPSQSDNSKAHICLYKITLEQFNDLLFQENNTSVEMENPLVDLTAVNALKNDYHILDVIKGTWYGTVLYLGMEEGLPILSITCSSSDIEKFIDGQLPICPPSSGYAYVLARGLVEGGIFSINDALAYVDGASKSLLFEKIME